jgi:hypothetical protein
MHAQPLATFSLLVVASADGEVLMAIAPHICQPPVLA